MTAKGCPNGEIPQEKNSVCKHNKQDIIILD